MSASICNGSMVSIHMPESILRGEGRGVGISETKKQSEGERGRHTRTHKLRCVTEGVKINAAQAKLFHCWCRV